MTQEAADLLQKALALSEKERAELASTLIDSLDAVTDNNVEAAWQEEIARRVEELQSGKAKPVSWDTVRKKARSILDGETTR